MFKTDKSIKKVLADYGTVAYVYRDGVVIRSTARIISKKIEFKVNVVDIFPCDVPIYFSNSTELLTGNKFDGVVIFHNPTILINGIQSIEIYMGNSSEALKRNGINCDTVTLKTIDGMRINSDMLTFKDGGRSYDISFDNSSKQTALQWRNASIHNDAHVVMHERTE